MRERDTWHVTVLSGLLRAEQRDREESERRSECISWACPSFQRRSRLGKEHRKEKAPPSSAGSGAIFLCAPGAVEACLLHQLKRRAAGFLRSDKMAALFTKVGKTCPVAGEICHKVQELQQQVEGR